jgi:hypothetical protein
MDQESESSFSFGGFLDDALTAATQMYVASQQSTPQLTSQPVPPQNQQVSAPTTVTVGGITVDKTVAIVSGVVIIGAITLLLLRR